MNRDYYCATQNLKQLTFTVEQTVRFLRDFSKLSIRVNMYAFIVFEVHFSVKVQ